MSSPHLEGVIEQLWRAAEDQAPPRIYALVDAARSDLIYPKIVGSGRESSCLHRGELARELAWVAPYLVALDRKDSFTHWLLENGWGKSWGIFVESTAALNELKRHFQSILMIYDEDANSLYFRYYDPRVLRVYLPTCNAGEIKTVFGPVNSYWLEGEDAAVLLKFTGHGGNLKVEERQLARP